MSMTFTTLASTQQPQLPSYTVVPDESGLTLLNPSLAERKTVKLRLANGLEAFLISDPKAEQSAAALSVESGSWHDPKEYPGMAHFLEHMLFLGTQAFPEENEYVQYITDNGGSFNAATYPDHTVYMFSINNDAFKGGLDRFSHFFKDPLLSTSSISRELHAVDQEHAKNVENDYRRLYMVFKETGNSAHPNACFSTGNAKTLSGIPEEAMRKWYLEHYHASRMHFFAISPLPLEEMMAATQLHFAEVRNEPTERPPLVEPMTSERQRGHVIYLKTIKDLKHLSLTWEVPRAFCGDLERSSLALIAHTLKAEGEKSLIQQLKQEELANKLSVDIERYHKDALFFSIDIDLTPHGISHVPTVISRCFEAIAHLKEKGIPRYLFDEMEKIALYRYQYQSRENAFQLAMKTANELLYEELKSYPRITTQPIGYDPASIEEFLTVLKPEHCLYSVMGDPLLTQVPPTHTEQWTKAEYAIQDIAKEELICWKDATCSFPLSLPQANPFLAENLSLEKEATSFTTPSLLLESDHAKIFHLKESDYQVPETSALFNLKSPLLDGSAKSLVLASLYLQALKEQLATPFFQADVAGLHPNFGLESTHIVLSVQGYSEKAPHLVKAIFSQLPHVTPTPEQFKRYHTSLLSVYDNASHELPISQAKEILRNVLTRDCPTSKEKSLALQSITWEEFNQFSKSLFEKAYIESFLYGNLSVESANALAKEVVSTLGSEPYPKNEHRKKWILKFPENRGPYLLTHQTARQGHGVLLMLAQGTFSFEKRAAQQILAKALNHAFYDTLRTKQQTGYYVFSGDKEEERELFQYFGVQSSTHQPRDLLARFDLFLEEFQKNLPQQINEERFESLKNALIVTLQMPPENLSGMGERLFLLAFQYEGDFNWIEKRIASLKELTFSKFQEIAGAFLTRENVKRIAVTVEGVLEPENVFQYQLITKQDIDLLQN